MYRALLPRGIVWATAAMFAMSMEYGALRPAAATDDFADAATSKIAYRSALTGSLLRCGSLAGRTLGATARVTTAKLVGAASGVPAYCDVRGVIAPSILFDVALPLAWNDRLYGLGNGGCGQVLAANFSQRDVGLANGFAVALTDTGIENVSGECTWAANHPDLARDFSYEGIHDTAVVAKQLLQLYYARTALASYYNSCSDGGHDGLEEAQKYPGDYEGIVAGAPLLGVGTLISNAWTTGAYGGLATGDSMTPAKVNYVASVVYGKCDKLDGVVDGLIADPQTCARAFEPKRDLAVCAPGNDAATCLTQGQLAAYEKALGPVISRGQPFYPGQPLGNEINLIGAQVAAPGMLPQSTHDYFLSNTFMQYLFPWPRTSPNEFGDLRFNFDVDPSRIAPFRSMFDATNLNLNAFFGRGGKILSYHGWADPLITPYGTIAFYEDEEQKYGSALESRFKLYMVPGMGHCHGGRGPAAFDPMTAMIDWVEGAAEPQAILARHLNGSGAVTFTRPLCAYPQVAHYGGGDPNVALSFRCVPGPTGVPGTGRGDGLQLP